MSPEVDADAFVDFQRDRAGDWIRAMAFFEELEHGPQVVRLTALTDDGELVQLTDAEYQSLVARFTRAFFKWRSASERNLTRP